jgi:uncharacterized OB-fold protein
MSVNSTEPIPVARDLFRWSEDGVDLVGSHCEDCGTYYFPKGLSCRNPDCTNKRVTDVLLGRTGRLYSYTVQSYRPPALFRSEPWQPYAIGLIDLPEHIRVMSMLSGFDLDNIEIGTQVELITESLYTDETGTRVHTYKYSPAAAEGKAQ